MKAKLLRWVLRHAPLLLFAVVVAVLGTLSPRFLSITNALNIAVQSAPVAVVAVGMTFVLLTAGVDLSVGAIMFVGAAVAAKLVLAGQPLLLAFGAMMVCGLALGAVNALFITRLRLAPFIVTLALLFIGRGFALWLTQTRAMNLPESVLHLGANHILGVPTPLMLLILVVVVAHLALTRTPYGRQLYAVGYDPQSAHKAGVRVKSLLCSVYIISGICAILGAMLALGQLGAVSPKFGENYEFKAIAAAVLGGTSLYGGRGSVWPGTILGALLIQMIESGLVMLNADPYLYPMITAGIIMLAVMIDSLRQAMLSRLDHRPIFRPEMS